VWENHVVEIFQELLHHQGNVIDVGANIGVHTITLARLVAPYKVYAIESERNSLNVTLEPLMKFLFSHLSVVTFVEYWVNILNKNLLLNNIRNVEIVPQFLKTSPKENGYQ
jgi:predicted RNA methylase